MSDDATAAAVALLLDRAPAVGAVRVVCVDGPAGAGKSTWASRFASAVGPRVGPVPVVHADDLYAGWDVVAGCTDRVAALDRFAVLVGRWLLDPWARGLGGEHPVHDWLDDTAPTRRRRVPPAPVAVLEGVGMGARTLRTRATLTVWVDGPDAEVRLRRVLDRDGTGIAGQMRRWQADESRWFAHDGTRAGADLVVPDPLPRQGAPSR